MNPTKKISTHTICTSINCIYQAQQYIRYIVMLVTEHTATVVINFI